MLWAGATIAAATFQVARNAVQRGMMASSGPWGATLVRFLFGLPFSLALVGVAILASGAAVLHPQAGLAFWWPALIGALAQVLATAALLQAMHHAGFAVGTALQQSSVPLAAVAGLVVFGDRLSLVAWIGVAITTAGLVVLVWPRELAGERRLLPGVVFGTLSGLLFGLALNGFRHAALAFEPDHAFFAAVSTVTLVQAVQTAGLVLFLLWRDPAALRAVLAGWRGSLGAGAFGALASTGWFFALALAPAAAVRSLGVIEMPIAAAAGRRMFRESLNFRQIFAGATICLGVVLTAGL